MPQICYESKRFSSDSMLVIEHANTIIDEYRAAGYDLTLRQLYYQFVARGLSENTMQAYKRIGGIINDGRLAGWIDWEAVEDRTRNLKERPHWISPHHIVQACARSYNVNLWTDQPYYVEVFVEKEALLGVVERPCLELDVPYFACRGYVSQSEMWNAAERIRTACQRWKDCREGETELDEEVENFRTPVIIHLGDHDPSGMDMSRDIRDRLNLFSNFSGTSHEDERGETISYTPFRIEVVRIALNRNQVDQYNPPPNPAKITDSRAKEYIDQHGTESWELDALDPEVINTLIRTEISKYLDRDKWENRKKEELEGRRELSQVAKYWTKAVRVTEE
jgi:hypothetical protein